MLPGVVEVGEQENTNDRSFVPLGTQRFRFRRLLISMPDRKTVRPPTDQEHQTLEAMTREAVGRVPMRAQMILLSARGYSAPRVAEIQYIAKVTVYKWIDRFDEEGPSGLYDQDREGRPRKLGPDAEAKRQRVLEAPPTEEGYDVSRWTAPRLARHLKRKLGTDVHPDRVRRALQRLEYRWKRPRRVLPKPPRWCDPGPDRSGEPIGGAASAQPHRGGQSDRSPLACAQKPDCRQSGAQARYAEGCLRAVLRAALPRKKHSERPAAL